MFVKLLRILIGFAAACLAAGLTMVLFVFTPSEIAGLPPDVASDRLGKTMELAGVVAVQAALFSAPFALVAAAIGEALRSRDWTYYVIAGLVIAGLGFFAQHSTEQTGQPSIVNNYALTAFLTSGFVGGVVYWLFSGRSAGGILPANELPPPVSTVAKKEAGTEKTKTSAAMPGAAPPGVAPEKA